MPRLTLLAAACGLFATSAAPPVLAADPAPPASTPIQRLPTVQVDAARVRGVDDFDLPASFTVVAADADNRRGAQVSELLDGIPGLVARDRQNYAQDTQLSIRGFGARSTFGVRGVRLLVDGIPASMPDGQAPPPRRRGRRKRRANGRKAIDFGHRDGPQNTPEQKAIAHSRQAQRAAG